LAGSISIMIAPCSVSSLTHWPAIFSIEAPSKGSALIVAVPEGRVLVFFGVSVFGAGFWARAEELDARIKSNKRKAVTAGRMSAKPRRGAMSIETPVFL